MKPRIFINIHYLELGGAETSLIGLLHALDPARADVDLFVNDPRGEMLRFVPEWVRVLPAVKEYTMTERPLREAVMSGCFGVAAARLRAKYLYGRYMRRRHPREGSAVFGYAGRYVTPALPDLGRFGRYDLAISYLAPHNIVLDKVQAARKACWIHTDYSRIDVDRDLELPVWSGYDKIVSISSAVTESFLSVFPELESKIEEIDNFLPADIVRSRAAEFEPEDMCRRGGETVLLTIGRYCHAKNLESIPVICRLLAERGHDVKWYIIGYGDDDYIRRSIAREGMEERVVILGKRSNPYPYIRCCDLYIQPSRFEGRSITVREAQCLGKPAVIADYPTSRSQIDNGVDGFIVPLESEAFADALGRILGDAEARERVIRGCAEAEKPREADLDKFYGLLGGA